VVPKVTTSESPSSGIQIRPIRNNLSYANVMSTLAVFLALAGGAIAATQLGRNSVKSRHIAPNAVKGVDAAERTFAEVPSARRADSAGTANSANTATLAGTAATANAVAPNSVGAGGIQDPVRSVNLPLASFVNASNQALLSFAENNGGAPELEFPTGGFTGPIAIEWDDDSDGSGGPDTDDREAVQIQFTVPPDYASGGEFALRVEKDGHAGQAEALEVINFVDTTSPGFFAGDFATITSAAPTTYILDPPQPDAYAPGQSVELNVRGQSGFGGANPDNFVYLLSAEFRYTAKQ
jgi:hypothetical protein